LEARSQNFRTVNPRTRTLNPRTPAPPSLDKPEGWQGWDEYAPFYDWENARTLGRRDVAYWRGIVRQEGTRTLELGCGTGRLLMPMARTGVPVVGIDRSTPMLARAWRRSRRLPHDRRPGLVRGDIRQLPFPNRAFGFVMAPYGLLQSLLDETDLHATLKDVARVLRKGGLLGVDLVPDLPSWSEYSKQISLRGRYPGGARVTLIESVRQDRRKRLTMFDEEFVERRGRAVARHTFSLTFRTLTVPEVCERLEGAGFRVDTVAGGYRGAAWTPESDVWLICARKR
jgi:ubiquinone/menaquinone biosynthesis C-methylase UbiE